MARKGGLGRGLGALLGEEIEEEPASVESVSKPEEEKTSKIKQDSKLNIPQGIDVDENGQMWVNPSLLKPNPHQPRQDFDEDALNELAMSIKEHGVIQSITIEDAHDGYFYIVAGERRTRAAQIAGLEKVPVQLRQYDDIKKLEIALIENIQRADLNPIEEASAYSQLKMMGGDLSDEDIAKRVGKKRSTITNSLRLLKLPSDMQTALVNGNITAGHARALLSVDDVEEQKILYSKIISSGMSVRDAESAAKSIKSTSENRKGVPVMPSSSLNDDSANDVDINSIEQKFINVLGTKVSLKGSLERGTLQIEYHSRSDLDRLYEIIIRESD